MGRRLRKFAVASFSVIFIAFLIIVAAFWWRLSKGPVSLAFLKDIVESRINASMPEAEISIQNVVIERDEKTGQPRMRLSEVQFKDKSGRLIARAPRAAIAVKGSALLVGNVIPQELELIGARLLIQRRSDGTIGLGFGTSKASDKTLAPKRSVNQLDETTDIFKGVEVLTTKAANLLDYLDGSKSTQGTVAAGLEKLNSVRITNTTITMYDETNGAVWHSPDASLVFRRAPYGFAMFVDGHIAARTKPWRIEMTAHYRSATQQFKISSRVFDVVPAEIAQDVFALSQFAQVQLPLSGHVEAEFTREGKMTRASAEFTAAAGRVGFPGYISEPIIIDEGLLRVDFEPKTGDIIIGNSAIFVGGSQAELSGRIKPVRAESGKLLALGIVLNATNVAIDATGSVRNPAMFDKVTFDGLASLENDRLIVNDLILMSGSAGIRVRGQFVGGKEAAGVFLAGTIRDIPAATIKKMWPPVVARGAREWIAENVISGRMSTGQFKVAIPAETIVAAGKDIPIPDEMVNFKFTVKDVQSRYFGDLPKLTGASGTGLLTGNHFELKVTGGTVRLPNKKVLKLTSATMKSRDLARPITPSIVTVKTTADARSVLALIDQKPLELLKSSGLLEDRVSGKVTVDLTLDLPLSRAMTKDQVTVRAKAKWKNAGYKQATEGVDITNGNFDIAVSGNGLVAKGKALVKGLPAQLEWRQAFTNNKQQVADLVLRTTITERKRAELGVDLSRFVRGRVGLQVKAQVKQGKVVKTQVEADLSKAILALDEIDWVHPAGKKTKAKFDFIPSKSTNKIANLLVTGGQLKISGSVILDKKGTLQKATFPTFKLDKTNQMSVIATKKGNEILIKIDGKSFDGRKLINQAFGARGRREGASETIVKAAQSAIRMKINVANVRANHGEQIKNVKGEVYAVGGKVRRASVRGQFVGGAPVSLEISPNTTNGRELRFIAQDAGAALRATNLYSKILGGKLSLKATLAAPPRVGIEKGMLVMRRFVVRDEATFDTIGAAGKKKTKPGPREKGQRFRKLQLPFSTDRVFVNIGDSLIKGSDLGASANGRIRKSDGAMDIAGTIIPAYGLNSAVSGVPVLGAILTGGKGQGVFGVTYALQGSVKSPKFIVNPVSALAPGFLRNLFAIGGGGNVGADGVGKKKFRPLKDDSNR